VERAVVAAQTAVSALDRLAAAYGIEDAFVDARGTVKHTADATKRALLAALGAPADDEAQAQAALDAVTRAAWIGPLPPVLVTRLDGPPRIALTLPGHPVAVAWLLRCEDGTEHAGAIDWARLPLIAECTLDGRRYERREFALAVALPVGYHTFSLAAPAADMSLIVSPGRCVVPPALLERKAWGVALQLYLLRSERNWGIGDFGDLRQCAETIAARGGDVVGLNPLHALFLDDPEAASPYSPASRLLLNVLNIDVEAVPGFAACAAAQAAVAAPAFQTLRAACRDAAQVRYADVAALKLPVLRLLHAQHAATGERAAFERFVDAAGEPLRRACIFQALRTARGATVAAWPAELRDVESPAVAAFAREHRDELDFLAWLQWIADEQLSVAAAAGLGMRIGLYRDLAVGADPNGAEIWSNPAAIVQRASVGAPPDIYNPPGQNWGLPPFHPLALRAEGYRSFIELVRANMRHAGAIRIDHVMALQHLYLIPAGSAPADGAYVTYPLDDFVGILALESERRQCLVIGEDLGTVPAGFRERMDAANILSYRVLFFETDPETEAFLVPDAYPERALAVVGSHDLPTLAAWWTGADIDLKRALALLDEAAAQAQHAERTRARTRLRDALRRAKLLPAAGEPEDGAVFLAVHRYLARSNALLAMAQLDDVTAETLPVNVPTTSVEHPNWRRRIGPTLEAIAHSARWNDLASAFNAERGGIRSAAQRLSSL
jgi:4-alpha-glucanotransferase